jgi:ribose 1,5-bisphosphokinase PhnN
MGYSAASSPASRRRAMFAVDGCGMDTLLATAINKVRGDILVTHRPYSAQTRAGDDNGEMFASMQK